MNGFLKLQEKGCYRAGKNLRSPASAGKFTRHGGPSFHSCTSIVAGQVPSLTTPCVPGPGPTKRERERQRERERKNASPLTILNKWPQVPIKAPGINL